ncbi:hypothetical protein LMH66_19990 [Shewanella sp. 10N.7]|uniref:hypothetical protein n=1 Tax=Shewanella sp. 10N.7 TaxID=2885093 RepID=UPI001E4D25AE|nr:hypothetical protein [Shewanella sp. 10N.7]MCC4834930.1 hypothetical protein [Shewanella sp. 10N.7]
MTSQSKYSLGLNAAFLTAILVLISAGASAKFFLSLYFIVCGGPSLIALIYRHNQSQPKSRTQQKQTPKKMQKKTKQTPLNNLAGYQAANDDGEK